MNEATFLVDFERTLEDIVRQCEQGHTFTEEETYFSLPLTTREPIVSGFLPCEIVDDSGLYSRMK